MVFFVVDGSGVLVVVVFFINLLMVGLDVGDVVGVGVGGVFLVGVFVVV